MIMLCWKSKKWKFAWRADPCPAILTKYHQVLTFVFTICLQLLITGCSPNPSVKCSPSFQCESCTSPSHRASGGPCSGGSPSSPLHLEQSCGCGSMTQSASEYLYVLKWTVEIEEALIYKCICFKCNSWTNSPLAFVQFSAWMETGRNLPTSSLESSVHLWTSLTWPTPYSPVLLLNHWVWEMVRPFLWIIKQCSYWQISLEMKQLKLIHSCQPALIQIKKCMLMIL